MFMFVCGHRPWRFYANTGGHHEQPNVARTAKAALYCTQSTPTNVHLRTLTQATARHAQGTVHPDATLVIHTTYNVLVYS